MFGCCFQMEMFLDCNRLGTLLLELFLKLAFSLCICKKYIFLFHYLRFVHGEWSSGIQKFSHLASGNLLASLYHTTRTLVKGIDCCIAGRSCFTCPLSCHSAAVITSRYGEKHLLSWTISVTEIQVELQ